MSKKTTLTVKELIEALSALDQSLPVYIVNSRMSVKRTTAMPFAVKDDQGVSSVEIDYDDGWLLNWDEYV